MYTGYDFVDEFTLNSTMFPAITHVVGLVIVVTVAKSLRTGLSSSSIPSSLRILVATPLCLKSYENLLPSSAILVLVQLPSVLEHVNVP